MNQKHPEILAPAGSPESLEAAVRCGADAVYLGLAGFNARASAENFTTENIASTVEYCHQRGVKVHLTLNTLVADDELDALLRTAQAAAMAGVDAAIVQDLGVAAALRAACPGLQLHASTQMTIHNAQGAAQAAALGFSRVVAARELSRQELAALCAPGLPEVEAFVHGALCMSISGQCYLSSMIGGRSGNRGRCAQPCRLPHKGATGEYSLSLKDLSLVDKLGELRDMGVASFKIEGRMKRPEYVAAAVTACRQALEGETPDFEALQAVFSRQGFTAGYFDGKLGVSMFGARQKEDVTAAAGVLGSLQALYRNETGRVPVRMHLTMEAERPAVLIGIDGDGNEVTVTGETPQAALKRPTDAELAARSLGKTGGTVFYPEEITSDIAPGLMLPVSALNALRASALEALLKRRSGNHPLPFDASVVRMPPARETNEQPLQLRVRLEHAGQLTEKIAGVEQIILPYWEIGSNPQLIQRLGGRLAAELPPVLFQRQMDEALAIIKQLTAQGLQAAVAGNLGQIAPLKALGLRVHGDYGLNLFNSLALAEYAALGLADITASFELNLKKIEALRGSLPVGILAYGHLPLMTVRNCPIRPAQGCGSCPGAGELIDRMGNHLPVRCLRKQVSRVLNPQVLYLADKDGWQRGLAFATLYFTGETPQDCDRVLGLYQRGGSLGDRRTAGLYYRTVE